MRISPLAVLSVASVACSASAVDIRGLARRLRGSPSPSSSAANREEVSFEDFADALAAGKEAEHQAQRSLAAPLDLGNCHNADLVASKTGYHPVLAAGWSGGYCRYAVDCDTPSYPSELECCLRAYAGQNSKFCLGQLPAGTVVPDDAESTTAWYNGSGSGLFYPDYRGAWVDEGCLEAASVLDIPSGRPRYDTMLECCNGAYARQESGEFSALVVFVLL